MMKLLAPPMKSLAKSARDLTRRAGDSRQWLASFSQPVVLEDAIPFQDPIDQICAERPPRIMDATLYVIVALFLTLLVTASLVHVDTVVVGRGRLQTATPPIVLQPLDTSIIRELRVQPGDKVKKGDILATLDPTFAKADLSALAAQQHSVEAEVRRLEAEVNNTPYDPGPAPTADERLQLTLYNQGRAQYDSQIRVFDEEIEQRKASIRTTEADRAAEAQQLKLARDVEDMRKTMLEKEIGSKLNYLKAQAGRVHIEETVADAENHLKELDHDLQSKEAGRQAFIEEWHHKTVESLIAARTEDARTSGGISKASLVNDLVVVTAPADGVVLDVAQRSVGSVMRGAEPLVTLVQSDAPLIADVMIDSSDIGHIQTGDDVVVKVDAFPYQIHGLLKGKLLSISEESFGSATPPNQDSMGIGNQDSGGAYHRGTVQLTSTKLDALPQGAKLIPGMTVSAEIKVGSRSVMSYFLYPITRGLTESIREP